VPGEISGIDNPMNSIIQNRGKSNHASVIEPLFVHYIWGTWQREPWLVGEVREIIHRTILAKCQESGAQMLAVNGIEDHVHLLVKIPPTVAIAQWIGIIKGASSYIANHQGSDVVFKWQDGYGAFTMSQSAIKTVIAYINNQQAHHASPMCRAVMTLDSRSSS
jgi:putative transposase